MNDTGMAIEPWTNGSSDVPAVKIPVTGDNGHVRSLSDIERDAIRLAIGIYGKDVGGLSEVARRFGIGRSTLYRKIHYLGIEGVIKPRVKTEPATNTQAQQTPA